LRQSLLGLIYQFLLRTYGAPAEARAEFERYLAGNWSSEWIEAARMALHEEQQQRDGEDPTAVRHGDVTLCDAAL